MEIPSSRSKAPSWFAATKAFENPSRGRAIGQLFDTMGPYLLIGLSAALLSRWGAPWFLLLPLGLAGGLFMIRLFILFHDCCHGSFWASRRTNAAWGWALGILTFTPFRSWRKAHGTHHAHNGNLDHRGVGDVWTLTLEEYRKASPFRRFQYRLYRNPFFLFLFSPPMLFLILQRFPEKGARAGESWSVHSTTLACLALLLVLGWSAGTSFLFFYVLPMVYMASVLGVWLFYVQHQFDPGYWEHQEEWDQYGAALQGSSFYRLPRWAQWFSGNIGFHHIHHLRPRIPNYRLEACCRAVPELQLSHPLTILASLKGLHLHLWDEASRRLVGFRNALRPLSTLLLSQFFGVTGAAEV
jgi:omega-6 fatty acid desaturase (delta-12 desaturase)